MLRRMSKSFEESNPPEGFIAATGVVASSVIDNTPPDSHRNGAAGASFDQQQQQQGQRQQAHLPPSQQEGAQDAAAGAPTKEDTRRTASGITSDFPAPDEADNFDNGYHFPPPHRWQESLKLGTIAFLKFIITPIGFFVVLYGLNIVAWGGMLFLLLINAAPAMCSPTCDHIDSPRRVWIEIDAQILNALFCVTGFGLAPWRFRDLYYLLKYRVLGNILGLRRLAGIHRSWFRLDGSQTLAPKLGPDDAHRLALEDPPPTGVPFPEKTIPAPPLTGIRAPPTKLWKMDFVVWTFVLNTLLQCVLSGFMWGMDRYTRPSWATGLFVCLGMFSGAAAGWVQFSEGRVIKSFEGIAVSDQDKKRLIRDKEKGYVHYNNIKGKKPKDGSDKLSMHRRLQLAGVPTEEGKVDHE